MCARMRGLKGIEQALIMRELQRINFQYNPNIAPTDSAPIVRTSSEGLKAELASFGLIHSWAKDKKSAAKYINTRAETVREKPVFKNAYQKRRCIIPVLGFYEWKEENGKKQPYYFRLKSGEAMPLIGIWEFTELNNEKIFSFSILTGEPNELVAPFHDRMPLATTDPLDWLDLSKDSLTNVKFFKPENYEVYPIDQIVNNARHKDIPDSVFERA